MTGTIAALIISFVFFAFGVFQEKEMLILIAIWLVSMFTLLEVVENK